MLSKKKKSSNYIEIALLSNTNAAMHNNSFIIMWPIYII